MLFNTIFFTILFSQTLAERGHMSKALSFNDSKMLLNGAKLVMSLTSGDAIVRRPRGSDIPPDIAARIENTTLKTNGSAEKPSKSAGNSNKKLSKNQDLNVTRNRQQHGSENGNGSLRLNKQRQLLKSQKHQDHRGHQSGKRNGGETSSAENKQRGKSDTSKAQSTCRYAKSVWSNCDPKTNTHSRTLTLKRGDKNCPATRTMQKKCKKACRYEKGTWSECKGGAMTRVDNLKSSSANAAADHYCETTRSVNRKCNPDGNTGKSSSSQQHGNGKGNKRDRKNKDKPKNRTNTQH